MFPMQYVPILKLNKAALETLLIQIQPIQFRLLLLFSQILQVRNLRKHPTKIAQLYLRKCTITKKHTLET